MFGLDTLQYRDLQVSNIFLQSCIQQPPLKISEFVKLAHIYALSPWSSGR